HGAPNSMAASVHAYMGPTGIVLALAGFIGVLTTARLTHRLERRLGDLYRLRRNGSGTRFSSRRPPDGARWSLGLPALLATVWAAQCGLYLLQENVEAAVVGRAMPGLAVVSGVHAMAPVVHLLVTLALIGGLWLVRRKVTTLADAVRQAEECLRAVVRVLTTNRPRLPRRAWTPLERWGTQRWSRPPPAQLIG
ncbi:MAG TPA: hypothetical protein VLL25_18890, partial [Acidimicrobiales bacterium]|nr:hypothetical protein [Acidimicrobiales bacterium]